MQYHTYGTLFKCIRDEGSICLESQTMILHEILLVLGFKPKSVKKHIFLHSVHAF